MKAIAINGSPRPGGNTEIMLEKVLEHLEAAGWSTELPRIGGRPVRGCIACLKCFEKRNGRCSVEKDDMNDYLEKIYASEVTRRCPSDSVERFTAALMDSQVDLNPHQVDAALFAFRSPLSKGAILADEVGLGKNIEAGILLSQKRLLPEAELTFNYSESGRKVSVLESRIGHAGTITVQRMTVKTLETEDYIITAAVEYVGVWMYEPFLMTKKSEGVAVCRSRHGRKQPMKTCTPFRKT